MDYAFQPAKPASIAISGTNARFPVRRIFCVGQNYLAHVLEMGGDPTNPPFFFSKPSDAVVENGAQITYASETENLHYEAELVVAIGTGGTQIPDTDALSHVWGYATGIDLTRRDLQTQAKDLGKPWDMAKGFDQSAPCGALHSVADVGHLTRADIVLSKNGQVHQNSNISDMIWSVPSIISTLSRYIKLAPGDLIYTGTPSGVGPVVAGDHLKVEITGLSELNISII